jgi:hypothetical protein
VKTKKETVKYDWYAEGLTDEGRCDLMISFVQDWELRLSSGTDKTVNMESFRFFMPECFNMRDPQGWCGFVAPGGKSIAVMPTVAKDVYFFDIDGGLVLPDQLMWKSLEEDLKCDRNGTRIYLTDRLLSGAGFDRSIENYRLFLEKKEFDLDYSITSQCGYWVTSMSWIEVWDERVWVKKLHEKTG